MDELKNVKAACNPDEILLVVDAMTGQEAATLTAAFNERVGITGAILTKVLYFLYFTMKFQYAYRSIKAISREVHVKVFAYEHEFFMIMQRCSNVCKLCTSDTFFGKPSISPNNQVF